MSEQNMLPRGQQKTKPELQENDSTSNLQQGSERTNDGAHFIPMPSWSTLQGL